VEVFDEQLRTRAVGRLATERMLRRAIDHNLIVVHYQPVLDLASGRMVGTEALVRILGDDHELLQPDTFLEVATETGLLIEIDELVLSDAILQVKGWRARLHGQDLGEVAINITARHLADSQFAADVVEQLDAGGVPHADLQIELTERVLMEASNSALDGLRALREAGVRVGLDDFGTGYSALAHLHEFPLDFVKIDRSSIHGLDTDPRKRAVAAAIVQLAHALDLLVVAEGVETAAELAVLDEEGCDRVQGFFIGVPGSVASIDLLMDAGRTPARA
jgi:EAL domain-containing protein (putative c-di-GMP-specific phosphodiesterase class I)